MDHWEHPLVRPCLAPHLAGCCHALTHGVQEGSGAQLRPPARTAAAREVRHTHCSALAPRASSLRPLLLLLPRGPPHAQHTRTTGSERTRGGGEPAPAPGCARPARASHGLSLQQVDVEEARASQGAGAGLRGASWHLQVTPASSVAGLTEASGALGAGVDGRHAWGGHGEEEIAPSPKVSH